ncbi:MAG: hypothetical protein DLM61_10765 [Pseudonocardiales bacterium]|nr:MAG: hypothetical protein DLM61_10765 [Pseudonocardiales bacterium]
MRREIRDAAARLFQLRGINSVTLHDVAAEVGLSKAALYHYFDTKDDLVRHIFSGWADASVVPFREIAEATLGPESKLRRIIALRIEQMVSDTDLFVLSMQEESSLPAGVREEFRQSKRDADHIVRQIIEEGQASGVFTPIDSHLIEFAIMGMCNWLWKWYDPNGVQSPAAITEAFIEIILRGICPAAERPGRNGENGRLNVAGHLAAIRVHMQALEHALTDQ